MGRKDFSSATSKATATSKRSVREFTQDLWVLNFVFFAHVRRLLKLRLRLHLKLKN